jgi:photosystem II stability/assembly factor-like uncharacterized protein
LSFIIAGLAAAAQAQPAWLTSRVDCDGDLIAVHFVSAQKGWIAGDNGFLASTIDGGKNWTRHNLNTTENINEIYFRNDDNGYLVAGRKMFVTGDGGRSWQETSIVGPGDIRVGTPEFLSIKFADKKRGLVVGSVLNRREQVIDSLVMRTEDGGTTWQRVIVPSRKELFHLDFVGSSRVWIVGDAGVILYSSDAGNTWEAQNSNTPRALYNVDFRDGKDGYAVGGRGTILRTENGGRNWELVPTNFPATFMRVDFADNKNGWIVGHGGTILRSGDRGKTWIKQESGTSDSLFGLFMTKKYGWAVGADGVLIAHVR